MKDKLIKLLLRLTAVLNEYTDAKRRRIERRIRR